MSAGPRPTRRPRHPTPPKGERRGASSTPAGGTHGPSQMGEALCHCYPRPEAEKGGCPLWGSHHVAHVTKAVFAGDFRPGGGRTEGVREEFGDLADGDGHARADVDRLVGPGGKREVDGSLVRCCHVGDVDEVASLASVL